MEEIESINNKLADALKAERLATRGMRLVGRIVSTKMRKTVTVEREIVKFLKKYKRWYVDRSKIHAHVPGDIELSEGDIVEIAQTRKISKTKAWVVTKVLKRGESS